MARIIRPDSDVALGNWSNPSWSTIDEVTADDGDYAESGGNPANDILIVGLGDVTDPNQDSDHTLRYRYQNTTTEGIDLVVKLKQGASTIATFTHTSISDSWTTTSSALTQAQASNISDYTDLRISFDANLTGLPGIPGPKCRVSWAELEVPDVYVAPAGMVFAS